MFEAVSAHMLMAVAATNWTNSPANSILDAISSTPRTGGAASSTSSMRRSDGVSCQSVEERLAHRHLAGAGQQHDRVLRTRIGHLVGGCEQDVHLAVRTEVELVDMSLSGRAGTSADRALAHRRTEREPDVRGLATCAGQSIAHGLVERAEGVANIRVVDEQLAVLGLRLEQLRVERVRLLDEPLLCE